MRPLLLAVALCCAGLVTNAAPAQATTVVRLTDQQLADNSALVIRGTVTDARVATYEVQPQLFTEYTVRIDEVLATELETGSEVVIRVPGGRTDDRHVVIPGMPGFTVGDEVVLFLETLPDAFGDSAAPGFLPVGLGQGVWREQTPGGWSRGEQDGLVGPVVTEPEPLPLQSVRALAQGAVR